jgi:hypothetical protein
MVKSHGIAGTASVATLSAWAESAVYPAPRDRPEIHAAPQQNVNDFSTFFLFMNPISFGERLMSER